MRLSLIVAMAQENVIGVRSTNSMPWHMPADLKYFREKTLQKAVIMGRKTFESIGKPLPQRVNYVVTRDTTFKCQGVEIFSSVNEAIESGKNTHSNTDEIMVIGGASLFDQVLPIVNRLYVTKIHAKVAGDIYFPSWCDPEYVEASPWQLYSREDYGRDEKNLYDYSYFIYDKK